MFYVSGKVNLDKNLLKINQSVRIKEVPLRPLSRNKICQSWIHQIGLMNSLLGSHYWSVYSL